MTELVYGCAGLMLGAFAVLHLRDGERGKGLFWAILGLLFGAGSWLPAWLCGLLVVALVALDGSGQVRHRHREAPAVRELPGWPILLPVIAIPLLTLGGSLGASRMGWEAGQGAVLGLGLGGVAAALCALAVTRGRLRELMDGGKELNDTLGAVSILPQLLASLGDAMAKAGVGPWLAGHVQALVPAGSVLGLVAANSLVMMTLSALTGNSFAAFPIVASGLTVPLLIQGLKGDPALCGMLTLTIGASGTLMTPMAANFNLVPAALLELDSPYAVIRCQVPVALAMAAGQILVLWWLLS